MKRILLFVTMMTVANGFAVEKKELLPLIETSATAIGNVYLETRDKIVGFGANALSALGILAVDGTLTWQQQLVARICYERIERREDIKDLLKIDWYSHPNFDPDWNKFIMGPEVAMRDMVTPDLMKIGLWYYYLEVQWKNTGEIAALRNSPHLWKSWCSEAVKDSPEERIWFLRLCTEFMADPDAPNSNPKLYFMLQAEKMTDEESLRLRKIGGYSTKLDQRIGDWFLDVLKYADVRSIDVLAKCIETHSSSIDFRSQLTAVRSRHVSPAAPPFRLGTNAVKIIKQP